MFNRTLVSRKSPHMNGNLFALTFISQASSNDEINRVARRIPGVFTSVSSSFSTEKN